jgi:pimeloyl-ACP methyl ester carboxylesterase
MATTRARRGYLDTPDGQIHYRTAGEGDPLLLLHQSPHSSSMFEPILPLFAARGYRAIAPDNPGFGNSDLPPFPEGAQPDGAYYARRLLEFADLLGLDSFYLFGHHTGAAFGSLIAAEHPERVRKLALWGYPLYDADARARMVARTTPPFPEDGAFLLQQWENRKRIGSPTLTPDVRVRLLIDRLQAGTHLHWGASAVGGMDLEGIARLVQAPTLLICGQRDSGWEQAKASVSLFPDLRFEVIEGASMDVADESPDLLVDLIDRFFRSPGSGPGGSPG